MQCEILNAPDEMTDPNILPKIGQLEKAVEDANDRTLRLGNRVEELRNFVHTDVNVRLVRVDERTSIMMWAVGIMFAAVLGAWVQLVTMNGRLGGIEADLRNLTGTVSGIRLKQLSANPDDPANIAEARDILTSATTKRVPIPQNVIREAGAKFIEAAELTPSAWNAANACIAYNSQTNAPPFDVAHLQHNIPDKWPTNYYRIPTTLGTMYWSGSAPPGENALFGVLGENFNAMLHGPAWVLFTGGEIVIDHYYMKQVVIRDAHIIYNGGPVDLKNVYFVNCTFSIKSSAPSQRLGTQLLAGGATNFSSGPSNPT